MTKMLNRLTDDEVSQSTPAGEEAGFGALATEKGRLPLRSLDVRARLDGLLGHVTVCQTFVNPFSEALEATYIFPLPDRAAVTRFRLEVAGRVVEGLLKERGQARRDYDQAIRAGHRAAITEEERPGVFTLRVGNLPPGESATVQLSLAGPLPYADGEITFRFPLVVAPRYVPGTPLPGPQAGDGTAADTDAVPDASRISPPVLLPGFPNPVHLSLAVDVHPSALPIESVRSSLHAVEEEVEGRVRRISLQPGARLDRDFILRLRVGQQTMRTSLLLHPDLANGREGTFLLTLVPPMAQAAPRPRDVVFVLDRSGSMDGWKMVAARRALGRMLDTLLDQDRFTVVAFDDRVETPTDLGRLRLVHATDRHRFRALEFLARVNSRGGTEMAEPLRLAVEELAAAGPGRDRVVVLVTDGQVSNEDQLIHSLGPKLRGIRIFCLGIDQAVNAGFLNRLADLGGGACELVESEDRLDEVMQAVHRKIGQPVLTGLKVEAAGGLAFDPESLVPGRLADVFAGSPVLVLGRYRGVAEGAVSLQARDATGRPWTVTVQGGPSDNPAVAAVWARGQVRKLEDRYLVEADRATLERLIVETSLRFGVLSRFTAYVAVDRVEVVNAGGQNRQMTQPVEMPAGWAEQEEGEVLARGGFGVIRKAKRVTGAPGAMPAPAAPPPMEEGVDRLDSLLCEFTDTAIDFTETGAPGSNGGADESGISLADEASDADFDEEERPRYMSSPASAAPRSPTAAHADFDDEVDEEASLGEYIPQGRGLLRRVIDFIKGLFFGSKPAEPLELVHCRDQTRHLLKMISTAGQGDTELRQRVLPTLASFLEMILRNLGSIPETKRLAELLPKLLALKPDADHAEIARLWWEVEDALREFAEGRAGVTT